MDFSGLGVRRTESDRLAINTWIDLCVREKYMYRLIPIQCHPIAIKMVMLRYCVLMTQALTSTGTEGLY